MTLRKFQRLLAARVRALREERGLKQDDMEIYGVSWKSVQKIEYGITDPKVSTLLKLADAFQISLVSLLDFEGAHPALRLPGGQALRGGEVLKKAGAAGPRGAAAPQRRRR